MEQTLNKLEIVNKSILINFQEVNQKTNCFLGKLNLGMYTYYVVFYFGGTFVDGGRSRGSSVRRPGNEDPQRREQKLGYFYIYCNHMFSMIPVDAFVIISK
jgi:hypothetical protein